VPPPERPPEEEPAGPSRGAVLAQRLLLLGARVPEPLLQAQAAWAGGLLARGRTGARVREGLEFAYGSTLSAPERARLSRAVCVHLLRLAFETGALFRMTPEGIEARTEIGGREHVAAAFDEGRGVLFVSGHVGNWEWSLAALSRLGPISVVTASLGQGPLEQAVQRARARLGVELIPMEDGRACLTALKRGRGLVLLADRRVRRGTAVCVPFFGHPASCVTGPARLALASGATVLYGGSRRLPDGRFHVGFRPAIPVIRTGDRTRDVWLNTARQQFMIEQAVRAEPAQWIWNRRRWLLRRDEPGADYAERLKLLPEFVPELPPVGDWRRWTPRRK
jgi:KDO2-lipid IV(A) lauroyltransferase